MSKRLDRTWDVCYNNHTEILLQSLPRSRLSQAQNFGQKNLFFKFFAVSQLNTRGGSKVSTPSRTSGCSRIRKSFFTIRRAAPTCPGNFPKDCRRVALFRATGGKKLPHGYNWEKTRRKNGEIWALRPLHRGGGCAIMPWHYVGKGRFS